LVPGRPDRFKAILPTLRRKGQAFRLAMLAEDRWGNVSDKVARTVGLRPSLPVVGLPTSVTFKSGDGPRVIDGLRLEAIGDLRIDVIDEHGGLLVRSNPLRVVEETGSGCIIGAIATGRAARASAPARPPNTSFAKHKAFLDIVGHQANDFQIDDAFWTEINRLRGRIRQAGEMVALPGYEWSENTGWAATATCSSHRKGENHPPLLQRPAGHTHQDRRPPRRTIFFKASREDASSSAHVGRTPIRYLSRPRWPPGSAQ